MPGPALLQAHLVLETHCRFRLILYWTRLSVDSFVHRPLQFLLEIVLDGSPSWGPIAIGLPVESRHILRRTFTGVFLQSF